MKTPVASLAAAALLVSVLATPAARAAAALKSSSSVKAEIPDQAARKVVVEQAAKLSHPIDPAPLAAGLKSPFEFDAGSVPPSSGSQAGSSGARGAAVGNKSARDLLEAITNSLTSGTQRVGVVEIGGKRALLLPGSSRRYSEGDKIPLRYENNVYDIEVAAIPNTTSYTLRYNGETTTRSTRPTGK